MGRQQGHHPVIGLEPTPAMIEAGAQRLCRFEEGTKWPDDFSALQVMAARNKAERVWRSMWIAGAKETMEDAEVVE